MKASLWFILVIVVCRSEAYHRRTRGNAMKVYRQVDHGVRAYLECL